MNNQERLVLFRNALKGISELQISYPDYPPFGSISNQLQYLIDIITDPKKSSEALFKIDLGLITAREVEPRSDATANLLYAVSAEVKEMLKDASVPKISLEELYLKLKSYYLTSGLSAESAEDAVNQIRENMKTVPEDLQRQGLEQALRMSNALVPKPNADSNGFAVKKVDRDAGAAANYNYEIYRGSALVARYWHDFRGDDHGVTFVNGISENWPVGKMTDFLEGGGSAPLKLSDKAIQYIASKISQSPLITGLPSGESFYAGYDNLVFQSPDHSHMIVANYLGEPPHGDSYHSLSVDNVTFPGFASGGMFAWSEDSRYFCCSWMGVKFERKTLIIDCALKRFFVLPEYFSDFRISWPKIIEIDEETELGSRSFNFMGSEVWTDAISLQPPSQQTSSGETLEGGTSA